MDGLQMCNETVGVQTEGPLLPRRERMRPGSELHPRQQRGPVAAFRIHQTATV